MALPETVSGRLEAFFSLPERHRPGGSEKNDRVAHPVLAKPFPGLDEFTEYPDGSRLRAIEEFQVFIGFFRSSPFLYAPLPLLQYDFMDTSCPVSIRKIP